MTPRWLHSKIFWAVLILFMAVWPLLTAGRFYHHIGVLVCTTAIAAASLHLIIRTGHVSLAHAGFMGVGGYACVLSFMNGGLAWPLALLAGGLASGLLGLVVGPIFMRLAGKYFVLVTFVFGEILRMAFVEAGDITGGANGISDIPPLSPLFGPENPEFRIAWYYLALALALLCVGMVGRLLASEFGRAIDSLREGERLAACSGVPVIRMKVTAFVIACFLAGIAGGMGALYGRYISPDYYNAVQSLNLVVMNVIGGMTSLAGALIGTVFMTVLPETLRSYQQYQPILFGLILLVTMAFVPGGLIEMGQRLAGLMRRRPREGAAG